ncbi:hypothetical protein B484DRAFT_458565 [Ochromonadaceae sp. CCMP2298]|nr:hypothetical protein B484DRAFT_458565 [Ochromonadaceae sp. CCMP2298]
MAESKPRKAELALRQELQSAQEVLALQQKETYKFQDYVEILDCEVNTLGKLLDEKQSVINALNETVLIREDKIKAQEKIIYDNTIDKAAFRTFETQNLLLLDELKENHERMTALEIEVRFLRNLRQDKSDYDDDRAKKIAAMEIVMTGTVRSLELQVEETKEEVGRKVRENTELDRKLSEMDRKLNDTSRLLHFNEETRREQVTRSRQSEYRTLSRLQDLTTRYYSALDEREVVDEELLINSNHNSRMQTQLKHTRSTLDTSQDFFGSALDTVESENDLLRDSERRLRGENQHLQVERNKLQLNVDSLQDQVDRHLGIDKRRTTH